MASADLRKELECSVCLDFYTDPVTLTCGHNYCRDCIGRVLDTQEGSGDYSCPECKQSFKKRPVSQKNLKLRNIVENYQSTHPDQEKSGVFCTYCIHTPVPAVRSCLHCEASLCDNHLRVHSKSPEHVLCDPTTSLGNRKCSVHKKILEYYCTEDSSCICVSCCLVGDHIGHRKESLDEASEKKKKKLRNVLQNLRRKGQKTEKRVQSLQEHRRKVQGEADEETERVTVLFRDLRRRLEDLEKRVLGDISGQAERISVLINALLQDLEIKKDTLYSRILYIKELCNMTDPLTVLQETDTGDLCDTEDGDDEDRERHDRLLHDGGDLDVAGISHTLHTGLSDIMSGGNVEKCTGTHVYPHSTTGGKGHTNGKPSRCPPPHNHPGHTSNSPIRRRPQPSPTIQHSHLWAGGPNIGSVQQTLGAADILLDVRTAGNHLHISDDRKTVTVTCQSQNYRDTPERFEYYQVISRQRFSSGRHYWEVDVGGGWRWKIGVCYPSIDRRGGQSQIGNNKKSWCLEWLEGNQYSVIHDSNKIPLPGGVSSERVGIYLDYEAGWISFFDVCDPIRHLHTFTTTFTEPLHAGILGGGGHLKICGGNQK